jgi:hypothetical protein
MLIYALTAYPQAMKCSVVQSTRADVTYRGCGVMDLDALVQASTCGATHARLLRCLRMVELPLDGWLPSSHMNDTKAQSDWRKSQPRT